MRLRGVTCILSSTLCICMLRFFRRCCNEVRPLLHHHLQSTINLNLPGVLLVLLSRPDCCFKTRHTFKTRDTPLTGPPPVCLRASSSQKRAEAKSRRSTMTCVGKPPLKTFQTPGCWVRFTGPRRCCPSICARIFLQKDYYGPLTDE